MTDLKHTPSPAIRLAKLRQQLITLNLAALIIPRHDQHQGEYVAANAERLNWLTGFSGSAGQAIVLTDKAAIFVDGRYTLQAANEVDEQLFEICHSGSISALDWLTENLPKNARIGFDSWLHSPQQLIPLQTVCNNKNAELIALDKNPIDAVWHDQPASPMAQVNHHDIQYSGLSSKHKRLTIADTLIKNKCNGQLITTPDSICWLLNVRGSDVEFAPFVMSFALIYEDGCVDWFVDQGKITKKLIDQLDNDIRIHAPQSIEQTLIAIGKQHLTIALDPAVAPERLNACLKNNGAEVIHLTDLCILTKAIKNKVEISGAVNAHNRDGIALTKFLHWFSVNAPLGRIDEIKAADKLEQFRQTNELFQGLSFPTISGFAGNGAIVHYRVSKQSSAAIHKGSLYLVDSGAQYLDGTTDVTRTLTVGTPTTQMKRHYTLVLKGHIQLGSAIFPKGTNGGQLDALARQPLWAEGLDYDHGTGHGVGSYLSVHEGPQRISKMPSSTALEPGMIISNEPGLYLTDQYGIRIENLVFVVEHRVPNTPVHRPMLGFKTLTMAPYDRALIDTSLLTTADINWVNNYHASVKKLISPHLDDDQAAWLDSQTAALG